ncbi:MAG: RidA family protein [Pseudomonadales bacterium]|nr:RidA family protein [Pseudomonadales bacterium]
MKILKLPFIASVMLASPLVFADSPDVEFYTTNPDMPFSEAVRVDNMLYLSGQLGYDPETKKLVEGGIAAETRKTMDGIKATLEKYGSSLSEVVKCTVFLADIKEWAAMNEVYVTYFPEHPPARSALGTNGLALGARTEIECIATVKDPG